jgi:hypothetical protein
MVTYSAAVAVPCNPSDSFLTALLTKGSRRVGELSLCI